MKKLMLFLFGIFLITGVLAFQLSNYDFKEDITTISKVGICDLKITTNTLSLSETKECTSKENTISLYGSSLEVKKDNKTGVIRIRAK